MNRPQVGIYFYPWYCSRKWAEFPTRHVPQIGKYISSDVSVIQWQIELLSQLGVDYVILEMVPAVDWSFDVVSIALPEIIKSLCNKNIQYSFLFDAFLFPGIDFFRKMYLYVKDSGLITENILKKNGKPLFFTFLPKPEDSLRVMIEYPELEIMSPAWFPEWDVSVREMRAQLEKIQANEFYKLYFSYFSDKAQTVKQAYAPLKFFQFWQYTSQTACINGFASVIPGYDDLLMQRNPQLAVKVPREKGHTLVEQFQAAFLTNPEHILIYSWNEYFEATNIEPSLEYGLFYFNLCKKLIAQVKDGKKPYFPIESGTPEPVLPLYLTPEIQKAAACHVDGVPRWDQDYYLADIFCECCPVTENGNIVFKEILIRNTGIRTWACISKQEPIKLSVRIVDKNGNTLSEGRTNFLQDIYPGESVCVAINADISNLEDEACMAIIGLVWENKFWFKNYFEYVIQQ